MASETTGTLPKKVEVLQRKDMWLAYYTPIDATASTRRLIITDNFGREIQFADVPIT